jgi:hypothetical protein
MQHETGKGKKMRLRQDRSESLIVAPQAPKAGGSGEAMLKGVRMARPATSAYLIYLAMIRFMLRRLAKS